MRHYLTVKTGEIPNINAVYDAFKDHARFSKPAELDPNVHVENLIKDIRAFGRYFCAIALGAEAEGDLNRAFHDLRELKVDVAYPLLLEMYHDYVSGQFSKDAFLRAVRLVESYVFRRAICGIPTNSMNKTFGTFMKAVDKANYLESVEAQFQLLPSYRRFPKDEEFHRDLQSRDLYHFRSRSYWLRRLENFDRKEPAPVDEYTIEHILPQNENLSNKWREDLGPDWRRVQQTWLHTLGNLTLTGYNSEYSDRSFGEKRDMNGGFKHSPLKVNEGLGQLDVWNEQAIRDRAARLADKALIVWRGPKLEDTQLKKYSSRKQPGSYSIQDHPHLSYPAIQPLFETFRKEVLALDPNVTEEFLKVSETPSAS